MKFLVSLLYKADRFDVAVRRRKTTAQKVVFLCLFHLER